ncbi:hypothetical protein MMC12_002998 [Toensbergia leucococca]|nr:hypothetical protein [Toensbergia leucococca]
MATTAHGLYCFEVLSASLEKRDSLSLSQVQQLWSQYQSRGASRETSKPGDHSGMTEEEDEDDQNDEDQDDEDPEPVPSTLSPPSASRLQAPSPSTASISPSPSSRSTTSSQLESASKSSSNSSFFSLSRPSPTPKYEEHPLFVTWNTLSSRGHKSLRGCIGTFEPLELESGLRSYALTSAFDDHRFSPITLSELNTLSTSVTLLTAFTPAANPLDWDLGTHGIRISFSHHGKMYGATYLPDVAVEQGWTKEETIVSLMRKAGWVGRSAEWKKMGDLRVVRYQGKKVDVEYQLWKEWKGWVEEGERR